MKSKVLQLTLKMPDDKNILSEEQKQFLVLLLKAKHLGHSELVLKFFDGRMASVELTEKVKLF